MTFRHLRRVERLRPETPGELHEFARRMLGLNVPRKPVVAGNSAPFAYLCWAYFEGPCRIKEEVKTRSVLGDVTIGGMPLRAPGREFVPVSGDCVVWANRGGGKTMLGAAATVLDLFFKPGVEVRILGGSLEQSGRMFHYLVRLLTQRGLRGVLRGRPTQRRVEIFNGSVAEILAQSQCSVRGTRVHKLRCDEVEEFDPEVWEAAQRVTHSQKLGGIEVTGSVEALSTMHRPFGLMAKLVEQRPGIVEPPQRPGMIEPPQRPGMIASQCDATMPGLLRNHAIAQAGNTPVFRWCALDVAERCDPRRHRCADCKLWPDCQGRAREAEGFMAIGDLIAQWQRSSFEAWASEMMCRQPRRSECVYPGFDAGRHVEEGKVDSATWIVDSEERAAEDRGAARAKTAPSSLSTTHHPLTTSSHLVAGMDFGMRSPLVMLWGRVEEEANSGKWIVNSEERAAEDRGAARATNAPSSPSTTHYPLTTSLTILDEYVESGLPLEEHLRRIAARGRGRDRGWGPIAWVGVDPAGNQRNAQTGQTDVSVLRRHGYVVRARASRLAWGIERIRARLDHGTLRIHPRCTQLIQALSTYHFDPRHQERQDPVKDGPDHLCDALRYLVVNLEAGGGEVTARGY